MTFVYAEKVENCVYVIADTFSVHGNGERVNWFSCPMRKIFRTGERYVVAFSGNSHVAQNAMRECSSDEHTLQVLQEHSSSGSTDFIVVDTVELCISKVSSGTRSSHQSCFLGSSSAMEKFQKFRHADDEGSLTRFAIYGCAEGLSEAACQRYKKSLSAFVRTLQETSGDFGGIAIPFFATTESSRFMSYAEVFRGDLQPEEVGHYPKPIRFTDLENGQFLVSVAGSERASGVYFPDASLGLIHSGYLDDLEYMRMVDVDGFEFERFAQKFGILGFISTWRNSRSLAIKIDGLTNSRDYAFAEALLKELERNIINSIASMNGGPSSSVSLSSLLFSGEELIISLSTLEETILYCRIAARYWEAKGDSARSAQVMGMQEMLQDAGNSLRFKVSLKTSR